MQETIELGVLQRIGHDGAIDRTFPKVLPLDQAEAALTRFNNATSKYRWILRPIHIALPADPTLTPVVCAG